MRVLGHLIIAAVLLCQAAVSQAQTLRIAVAAFPPNFRESVYRSQPAVCGTLVVHL